MINIKKYWRIILFFSASVIMVAYFITDYMTPHDNIETNITTRQIIDSSITSNNLWNHRFFISDKGLQFTDNMAITLASEAFQIIGLNLRTGEIEWSTEAKGLRDIVIDETRGHAYVFRIHGDRELLAVDVSNGEKIWSNTQHFERNNVITYVLSDGGIFVLNGIHGFRPVNPDTGEFGASLELPELNPPLFLIADDVFWRRANHHLEARNVRDGKLIWTSQYDGLRDGILEELVLSNNVIVIYQNGLLALDREMGAILWQYNDSLLASNATISNGIVYILDINANLLMFDELTGNLINNIQFAEPPKSAQELSDNVGQITRSQVAISNNIIVIYFGDTDTLAAYEIE